MLSLVTWRRLAVIGSVCLLSACAQPQGPMVASNPPPTAPGPRATWFHVVFDNNSAAIPPDGQKVVTDVVSFMRGNPAAEATIIGRTDSVGNADQNMRLSHQRADAVRDALVYGGRIAPDRVESRWTGEQRQTVPTPNNTAAAANRVVDIAIH